ncbi:MAG TPA: DUF5989 family protein [Candidatus Binatia bacterium]|jgi:hypothetical protein
MLGQFLSFLWARRLWWLVPMLTALLIVAILMLMSQENPVAPFLYPLF